MGEALSTSGIGRASPKVFRMNDSTVCLRTLLSLRCVPLWPKNFGGG
jgi:hypothetical protein